MYWGEDLERILSSEKDLEQQQKNQCLVQSVSKKETITWNWNEVIASILNPSYFRYGISNFVA